MDGFGTLNGQLINSNSPILKNDFVNSLKFDTTTDRNIIGATKLKNFSFNAGTGGTIVLGGASNGNGVLKVKDSGGTTRVTLDNTGLSILDGKITITNTAGGTVLDQSGIVSTVNFPNAYLFSNSSSNTASTSLVAIPGASLSSFVLTRPTNVFVFCTIYGYNAHFYSTGNTITIQGSDSVNGQIFSFPLFETSAVFNIDFAGSAWSTLTTDDHGGFNIISTLSAGTHNLTLNYKADTGGTAHIDDFAFGYIVLGG